MAKGMYVEITNAYIGVNGVARRIVSAYVGDENGKARKFYQAQEEIYLENPSVYINDGILSWDDIEGAEWYDIYVTKTDLEGNEQEFLVGKYPAQTSESFGSHIVRVQNYSGDTRRLRLVARFESNPTSVEVSEPDLADAENDYIDLAIGDEKEIVVKNGQELEFIKTGDISLSEQEECVLGNINIDNENNKLYIGYTDMNDVDLVDTGDIKWIHGGD